MAKGWMTNSKNRNGIFNTSNGGMYKGLKTIGRIPIIFDGNSGAAKTGFLDSFQWKYTRYFRGGTYKWQRGWHTSPEGEKDISDLKRSDVMISRNMLAATIIFSIKSIELPRRMAG